MQAVTGVEGHGLKPWREVIMPHQDVRDGNLRGAEFAADLYYVSLGDGSAGSTWTRWSSSGAPT